MKTAPVALACLVALAAAANLARADDPSPSVPAPVVVPSSSASSAPSAVPAAAPPPAVPAPQRPAKTPGHWTEEAERPFISLRADAGYLYLKPRVSVGYGKPFALWGGLDVVPFATPDAAGGYGGLRLQLDWFELRGGARFVHAFWHNFLSQKPSYDLVDLAENTGHPSNYVDLEAEVAAAIPAGPGDILLLGTAESIQLVPSGFNVYDETLHVIVAPTPVYRERLGYSLPFMAEHNARAGIVGEVIEIPNRGDQVVRAGIVASFDIDDHLQVVATVLAPVYGPDSLGLAGADYTELGLRYRWASGHTHVPQEMLPGSGETAVLTR
jgi:hypothetical protein